jgi:hypothetical protein
VLFFDFNNDISFEIDGKLVVLIEHQSTINPNMALRLLFYITRVLEKKMKGRTLYSRMSCPGRSFMSCITVPNHSLTARFISCPISL